MPAASVVTTDLTVSREAKSTNNKQTIRSIVVEIEVPASGVCCVPRRPWTCFCTGDISRTAIMQRGLTLVKRVDPTGIEYHGLSSATGPRLPRRCIETLGTVESGTAQGGGDVNAL